NEERRIENEGPLSSFFILNSSFFILHFCRLRAVFRTVIKEPGKEGYPVPQPMPGPAFFGGGLMAETARGGQAVGMEQYVPVAALSVILDLLGRHSPGGKLRLDDGNCFQFHTMPVNGDAV